MIRHRPGGAEVEEAAEAAAVAGVGVEVFPEAVEAVFPEEEAAAGFPAWGLPAAAGFRDRPVGETDRGVAAGHPRFPPGIQAVPGRASRAPAVLIARLAASAPPSRLLPVGGTVPAGLSIPVMVFDRTDRRIPANPGTVEAVIIITAIGMIGMTGTGMADGTGIRTAAHGEQRSWSERPLRQPLTRWERSSARRPLSSCPAPR